jgi:hypothetical protein
MRTLVALGIFVAGIVVGAMLATILLVLAPESRVRLVPNGPTPTRTTQPSSSPLPTASPSPLVFPTPNSNLNFAGGDFETVADVNNCKMLVRFAATSNRDGSSGTGSISLAAVQSPSCTGQATGRITCLLVSGNHAVFSGWLDDSSGIFDIGNVVQGTVTQDDPQPYGPPVDRAGIGIANGSPECPPAISGTGPAIMTGTLQVIASKPK